MIVLLSIFAAAGALAVIAVIFAVINWVWLATLSSRITELDAEISKKTLEFDTLRKEPYHYLQASEQPQASPPSTDALEHSVAEEGGKIQIFRNVRTNYSHTPKSNAYTNEADSSSLMTGTISSSETPAAIEVTSPDETHVEQVAITEKDDLYPSTDVESYAPATSLKGPVSILHASEDAIAASAAEPATAADTDHTQEFQTSTAGEAGESDILDVVSTEEPPAQDVAFATPSLYVIRLYSPSKKDADFAAAWKLINEYLSRRSGEDICIDFNNILFLYENEIHSLEQMAALAAKYRTSLRFINCADDVLRALRAQPILAPLVTTA